MSLALEVDLVYSGSALGYCNLKHRETIAFVIFIRPIQVHLEYKTKIGETKTQNYPDTQPNQLAQWILDSVKSSRLEAKVRGIQNIEQIKQGDYYKFIFLGDQTELKRLLNLD